MHFYRGNNQLLLIIFQSLSPSTDLVVLDLAAHHPEGVVASVMVDVNPAKARGAASWDPLLVGVVIHHDGSSGLADALFAGKDTKHKHYTLKKKDQSCDTLPVVLSLAAAENRVEDTNIHPPSSYKPFHTFC